jgi:Methyltransferase domain
MMRAISLGGRDRTAAGYDAAAATFDRHRALPAQVPAAIRAAGIGAERPRLAQADGERLPFAKATFDAVLMVQVFGGMVGWRRILADAQRVLQPQGALMIGRVVAPRRRV